MLPITVMLAVDKGICCWLLTAAETLGVSAWGLSSRNALCCLPHSLGSFARQMKHAGFCSGTGSLQGAVPSGGSAAQAITALGELTVKPQVMTNLLYSHLVLDHCKSGPLLFIFSMQKGIHGLACF